MDGTSKKTEVLQGRHILFCRVPGLLAQAARQNRELSELASPLVVAEGRRVRDVCPTAHSQGIREGMNLIQARRLCPTLLAVPQDTIDPRPLTTAAFFDVLADLSPVVEPHGPDAAFADLSGLPLAERGSAAAIAERIQATLAVVPLLGIGPSRTAARAVAECRLPSSHLCYADVRWLWPEDEAVTARLKRLGLVTFGQVAAIGESALVYQFGRRGRLLHRRALGQDFAPVLALYPPPRADAFRDLSEYPLDDRNRLHAVLAQLAEEAAKELHRLGRFGRRVVLSVQTEQGEELRRDWVLPVPIQSTNDVLKASQRLLSQMRLSSPVTRLRVLVEDLEMPTVRTADLFGGKAQERKIALQAVRHALTARYGPQALRGLGQQPVTVRDTRHSLIHEQGYAGP